jgi:hypothetical protein
VESAQFKDLLLQLQCVEWQRERRMRQNGMDDPDIDLQKYFQLFFGRCTIAI